MYILTGLGNPEFEYIGTRHNIGFDFINFLSKKLRIKIQKLKWKAEIGEGIIYFDDKKEEILLVKPITYMNLSGEAVLEIVSNLKIDLKKLIVIHDDMDLPIGGVHFIFDRGDGGHKGVKSIVEKLKTNEFYRLRFGIGRPPEYIDPINYVLSPISLIERKKIRSAFNLGEEIIKTFIFYGEEKAISKSNKKGIY
ncbi:MAG: aminoacyl-tRNA hydrolase [Caldisericia bacterium]|nr:aminoacyl-tRNA hydrolase [Caldisericia bacterium]